MYSSKLLYTSQSEEHVFICDMHKQFSYITTVTPYVKIYVTVTEELFGIWPESVCSECNWDTI